MNKCQTCKWWAKKSDWENGKLEPVDSETFEPMVMPYEVRFCTSPLLARFEFPPDKNRASLYDGSEYYAEIVSGPDFGCVNHEPL